MFIFSRRLDELQRRAGHFPGMEDVVYVKTFFKLAIRFFTGADLPVDPLELDSAYLENLRSKVSSTYLSIWKEKIK